MDKKKIIKSVKKEMLVSGKDDVTVRVQISRSVSDINLRLDEVTLN